MSEERGTADALERWFSGEAAPPADRAIEHALDEVASLPQRHRWWPLVPTHARRPTIAGRPAGIRPASIAIAAGLAVLLVGAATLPGVLVPEETGGQVIVVSSDGRADASDIADALGRAKDGDTITIRPGTYTGGLIIDKDITIVGEGPPGDVVIVAAEDRPVEGDDLVAAWTYAFTEWEAWYPTAFAFVLEDSEATLRGLTIEAPKIAQAIVIRDGSPSLEELDIQVAGDPAPWKSVEARVAVHYLGGATGRLSDSTLAGEVWIEEGSAPVIERNVVGCHMGIFGQGSSPLIKDNHVLDDEACEFGLSIGGGATPTIEGNDIALRSGTGIVIDGTWLQAPGPASAPIIVGNTIRDSATAISIDRDAAPVVRANVVVDNGIGITARSHGAHVVENTISGNRVGVTVWSVAPTLEDNVISANVTGIQMDEAAAPGLRDNAICGNETNLKVGASAVGSTDEDGCLIMPAT